MNKTIEFEGRVIDIPDYALAIRHDTIYKIEEICQKLPKFGELDFNCSAVKFELGIFFFAYLNSLNATYNVSYNYGSICLAVLVDALKQLYGNSIKSNLDIYDLIHLRIKQYLESGNQTFPEIFLKVLPNTLLSAARLESVEDSYSLYLIGFTEMLEFKSKMSKIYTELLTPYFESSVFIYQKFGYNMSFNQMYKKYGYCYDSSLDKMNIINDYNSFDEDDFNIEFDNDEDPEVLTNKGVEAANEQKYSVAAKYYKLAAEKGDPAAQFLLGLSYEKGEGVIQNFSEAAKYYRLVADIGIAQAQFSLGCLYLNGQGVPQNYNEAVKYFRLAAEQGDARAQYNLGLSYLNGQGVTQNYKEAIKNLLLAAEHGIAEAQCNLGYLYENGEGVSQNYSEVAKYFHLAADQGYSMAQFNLGCLYLNGKGVSQDYKEANKYFYLAAEQGEASAQFNLGLSYLKGLGVIQNYKKAAKYFHLAAEQGDVDSQFYLACLYGEGQGIPQNVRKAAKYFHLAAEQGHAGAQFNMGFIYENGIGVEQNLSKAAKYYRLAAEQGDDEAEEKLEKLKNLI